MTNGPEDKLPISFPSARLEKWKDRARALKALGVRESDDIIRFATSLVEAPNVGKAKAHLCALQTAVERNVDATLRAQATRAAHQPRKQNDQGTGD